MQTPKISVNKLGEYLNATPSRRSTILKDQKYPSKFKTVRYKDARDTIVDFTKSGMSNETVVLNKIDELSRYVSNSEFKDQDKRLSAISIETFLDISDDIDIDFQKYQIESVDNFSENHTMISGVSISIRPDILIKNNDNGFVVGAMKLHFSKTTPLGDEGCKYVATAMKSYLEENNPSSKIDNKMCLVVDIPNKNVKHAPNAYKKRMKDIRLHVRKSVNVGKKFNKYFPRLYNQITTQEISYNITERVG